MTSQLVLPLTAGGIPAATAAEVAAATATSSSIIPAPTGPERVVTGSDASNASSSPNFIIAIVGAILGTMIFVTLILLAFMWGKKHGKTRNRSAESREQQQPWKPSSSSTLGSRRSSSEIEMKATYANPYNPGVPPRPPPPPPPPQAQTPRQHIGMLSVPRSRFEDRTDVRSLGISRPLTPSSRRT